MKCIIDTNVLISTSLFPNGVTAQAYFKAVASPYSAVVCDYSLDELHRVYNRKFKNKLRTLESFLSLLFRTVKIIDTPSEEEAVESETAICDLDDRPILRAAIKANVDILITGDSDFLKSGLTHPHIIKPADFLIM
ncbi:MAG: putative toxin-antitoxin system toxin component, PIN family [Oscillospiraceae bacterium]|nr:putative toxin-antitoxin system toxin component, PIN family [Oscillospiraceae bacterium]